ncbi:GIY-YIG nuclease family protein [uncultured Flavobacterium sp.]|uniref:GIY-YIG nuclease family protein n=1 Tax=uncultured Flavobacterium sp. TaxID=165435 RepID=UPI0025F2107B|nr:GIY-YIG nuclease family protein [uncultured Flavobacterium sp.]
MLFSHSKSKFYAGQTKDLGNRIYRHNSGQSISTKSGIPWNLVYTTQFEVRSEAVGLESKIKKRGIRRYLEDIKFDFKDISSRI